MVYVLPNSIKWFFVNFQIENVNLIIWITETLFAHRFVEAEKSFCRPFKYNNFNVIMQCVYRSYIRAALEVFALTLLKSLLCINVVLQLAKHASSWRLLRCS
jgi:hypothetical protein